jgi:hypothetical protein
MEEEKSMKETERQQAEENQEGESPGSLGNNVGCEIQQDRDCKLSRT